MEKKPIYTIGHGIRKPGDFLILLKSNNIQYLIDIRSQPYSKYNSSFNQDELKHLLESKKNAVPKLYAYLLDRVKVSKGKAKCMAHRFWKTKHKLAWSQNQSSNRKN